MKRILSLTLIFIVSVSLLPVEYAHAGRNKTLSYVKRKKVVKLYISEIVNSSENSDVKVGDLKKDIESAFLNRTTFKFEIIGDKDSADIVLSLDIKEYEWMDVDPVDSLAPFMMSLDAATKEHYARMQILVTVSRPGKKRKLFNGQIQAAVTNGLMTESESYKLVNKRMAAVIIRKLLKEEKH